MIPQTLEQWNYCIVHKCKINLTREFANERLLVYQDRHHPETEKFAALYGTQHLQNIINWFRLIATA